MLKTIKNGTITAKIDTLGAELKSLVKDGVEYIWQCDPKYWSSCAIVLFPVVARLKNQVLTIDGKDYPMTMHGFVREAELEVINHTESSITFRYEDNELTHTMYPWKFIFDVTFSIENDVLKCGFQVVNTDETEMLFCVGGHPGFNVPMFDGDKFEDYCLVFEKEEVLWSNHVNEDESISATNKDLILDGGNVVDLKRCLFNNDAMIFEDIKSDWVNLVNKKTGKGIHFEYKDFPTLAVWTRGEPSDAPYVCLEPWIGMGFRDNENSNMEEKFGVLKLAPGKTFDAAFTMEII